MLTSVWKCPHHTSISVPAARLFKWLCPEYEVNNVFPMGLSPETMYCHWTSNSLKAFLLDCQLLFRTALWHLLQVRTIQGVQGTTWENFNRQFQNFFPICRHRVTSHNSTLLTPPTAKVICYIWLPPETGGSFDRSPILTK